MQTGSTIKLVQTYREHFLNRVIIKSGKFVIFIIIVVSSLRVTFQAQN